MKHTSFYHPDSKPTALKRLAIWCLIGLPATTLLLLATQSGLGDRLYQLGNQALNPLETPYRYPYPDSLPQGAGTQVRIEQEIGFYQEQIRQNPGGALDQASLAMAYLRMARATGQGNWYLLAEETARQSLAKLSYSNTEAMLVLARVAEAHHDFAGATQLARQIPNEEAIAIQVTTNLALGNLDAASQAVNDLVDRTLSMNAFTLQAMVQTAQGKYQEAWQSFQNALQVEEPGELGNSARTRTLLGRWHYEQGQLQQAEALYREALRVSPGYAQALLNLAQLDIRRGQYRSAERHYAQIVAAAGGNPTVYDPLILRGRARIKVLQGDRAGAEELWAQAEILLRQSFVGGNSDSFGHRRDLAQVLLDRGTPQDVVEAIALMQDEVKLRRDADTLDTLAWALFSAGRWQEAQSIIQEAIAQGVRDAGFFYHAGKIEQALGNTDQANHYFQNAQTIDPTFGDHTRNALGLGAGLGS